MQLDLRSNGWVDRPLRASPFCLSLVNQPPHPELEPLSRIQLLSAIGVTALLLLIVSRLWLLFAQGILLPVKWSIADCGIGIGLGAFIVLISGIVYRIWPLYRSSADAYLALVLTPMTLPDLVWLGILPGLSEELLFRGIMLPTLGFNTFAIVFSSLCFGVLHFSGTQYWAYVVWATLIGALLGLSAVQTQNLLVPIVAHTIANLTSAYAWKLSHRTSSSSSS